MIDHASTRRSDEHFASILYETENWTVNCLDGKILCEVASLRSAVEQAVEFEAFGHHIVAVVRERGPEIVVFSTQMHMLIDQLFDRDNYHITRYAMKA